MSTTPPPDATRARLRPSRARGAVLSALLLTGFLLAYSGLATRGPALCPTRVLLGLPCPGCGLTRAASALAHGDLAYATALNIAAVPLGFGAAVLALAAVTELATGRDWVGRLWSRRRVRGTVLALMLGLTIGSWGTNLYRHLHGVGPLQLASWHEHRGAGAHAR